ncbi:hypothetical protein BDN71DRAFT_1451292 [Pleurotus eryngii]|uniref:Uncharacterized protein n=1 Tax=Pleurotus eryngii TaxID=5323 RepID=A0A9P5ZUH8_PLEER|nr:hypothetical protein BDN71DRAFT_1451292 [Pleurotus eryngii]
MVGIFELSGRYTNSNGWSQGSHTLRGILVHRSTLPFSSEFRPLFDAVPTLEFVEYKFGHMHDPGIRWYRDAPSTVSVRWLCNNHEEWLADWEKDWEPLRRSLDGESLVY